MQDGGEMKGPLKKAIKSMDNLFLGLHIIYFLMLRTAKSASMIHI